MAKENIIRKQEGEKRGDAKKEKKLVKGKERRGRGRREAVGKRKTIMRKRREGSEEDMRKGR